MLIGSQAFAAARIVYESKQSSFAGPALHTAANELGKRFTRKSKKAAADAANSTAAAPAVSTTPHA